MLYRKPLILLTILTMVIGFSTITTAQEGDLAPAGETGQIYYAPFPVSITLDGEIDDWEGVPRGLLSGNNHTAVFAAASDGENVYFLADVTDENIISGEHGQDYWNEDSVEFYLNGTGDLTLTSYIDGVSQITIPALNKDLPSEEAVLSGVQNSQAEPTVNVVETDKGYLVEMAVPVETEFWNITPEHGATIGFQVHLNGANDANRDTKLIWSVFDTSDQSYLNPSVFGYLIFYEVGQTDLPQPPEAVDVAIADLPPVPDSALYKNGSMPAEARIIDLMSRMSLDEKIAQMMLVEKNSININDLTELGIGGVLSGGGGYPLQNTPQGWASMVNTFQDAALLSRLGIPMIYGVDAVHGHNNVNGAVVYPHNVGLGATRNADLVEQICRSTAQEMIATGIYWNYSPVVAVPQDIRWGRTYETFGENTDLVIELAMACVNGMQGDDIGAPDTVIATPKHYVGDGGAEWGTSTTGNYEIDQGVMNVDEATLRDIHLPPYIAAVENGAGSIMISFSSWNDEKMHGQQYLITDVLKGELGFEGFIVSDWAGIDQISSDFYDSVVQGVNAGIDMVMVPYNYLRFIDTLTQAVNNGDVSVERIDDAVRRILMTKFEMGLFENPYANPEMMESFGSAEHREFGRQAVAQSQVLLKNEGDVLPLGDDVSTIFVAGSAADNVGIQSGGWTIEWQGITSNDIPGTTILEGINALAPEGTTVEYSEDGTFEGTANVGIVVVGERPYAEGLGDDPDLTLSAADLATIEAVSTQVDSVVVVIVSGRPLMITEHIENWDAVVAAWLPGTEGQGVADVLFGYQPFTGKLPLTWPASVDQLPLPVEDPLFEFGYGLETEASREPVEFDYSTVLATDEGGEEPVEETLTVEETITLADFEFESLPEPTTDANGNGLGLIPWGDTAGNVTIAASSEAPENDTTALEISYDIGAWGGFSWVPGTETWDAQDWTAYDGVTFDLYGNNTDGTVQVEIFDNRTTDGDSAERWYYHVTDDYEGWQTFVVPFSAFQRRTDWQPEGAPDDGLGLNEVHGMAFGMPVGTGAQVAYLDNLAVFTAAGDVSAAPSADTAEPEEAAADESTSDETTSNLLDAPAGETVHVVDDFEFDALPAFVQDAFGNNIGLVPWGDTAGNVVIDVAADAPEMADSTVLSVAYDVAAWGGFSHVNNDSENWTAEDWSDFYGIQFMLYGNNTGGTIQFEVFDNRTNDGDSAERWYYHVIDDFEGWQLIQIPFNEFQRRTDWQPGGAPDDGLGLDAVSGYAFGMPVGVGAFTAFIDDVALYGGGDDAEVSVAVPEQGEPEVDRVEVEDYNFNAPWTLVWEDNFDAAADEPINPEDWTCEVGGFGWHNNAELQYYRDSTENVAHNGEGQLVITAIEESVEDGACRDGVCEYTSGRCITEDKQEFTYGKIEARIRVPEGQGIWPAFWMLGGNFAEVSWPNSGEIDILENIGSEPNTVHGTVHGPGYSGAAGRGGGLNLDAPLADDFHVYSIEWEPNVIRWYIDGEEYFSLTPEDLAGYDWVFDHEFFLLINVAVGGYWPGYPDETTTFPQTMEIDYIRVYQRQ
ncbi:MAG: family 16 glycosylhydrolase [Chloroflexi bacterium]|nr:family 16 glycosylhydrolase [Chloroflexota bacterium]